ncbi:hypothetical protein ACIRQH_40735 [Streptomyces sp. NPDC102279]|uniref:hypothetical protein n=1 Tax=Streptomyces sp. NPDC102279 TaxID=3366153 RepID=UPI0038143F4A
MTTLAAGCGKAQTPKGASPSTSLSNSRALTDAEALRIADAQQVLIRKCMERDGFTYWEAERPSLEESRTLGYVLDDVDWARRHAYGSRISAQEDRRRRADLNIAYHKSLSAERRKEYDEALDGGLQAPVISATLPGGGVVQKREGGCVAESESQLYGDVRAWFRAEKISGGLQSLYVPKVMADGKFTAALNAWSQCMTHAGRPYSDPQAARQAAAQRSVRLGVDKAFPSERDLAVADATCARKTSLKAIGEAREAHYIEELPKRYGKALETWHGFQHRALVRARALVDART